MKKLSPSTTTSPPHNHRRTHPATNLVVKQNHRCLATQISLATGNHLAARRVCLARRSQRKTMHQRKKQQNFNNL